MVYSSTKLNPTAPSFARVEAPTTPHSAMPPTPPAEGSVRDTDSDTTPKAFDKANLPDWMLVDENEKLRVAALSLSKTTTRDEWVTRLQHFSDLLAPGFAIVSTDGAQRPAWQPLAVRHMPPALQPDLTTHEVTFGFDFIQNELRGIEWSPGFYFIHPKDRREGSKLTAYWILDADLDPYLPKQPGEHGAKLTPFFNSTLSGAGEAPSEKDYNNTPVFIGNNYRSEYRYFGHYSQTRFSDKLDYERMTDGTVPPFVLEMWAKNLTQAGLQPWVKDELRQHIWPKPTYHGPLPLNSPSESPGSDGSQSPTVQQDAHAHDRRVKKAIQRYSEDLQAWEIDSKLRLSMLKEADIHRLFRAADADEQVGLRLWFEYLQCTAYENSFYERMVQLKYNENQQRGYQEKVTELKRQGWRFQLVEKTTGSGHTALVEKLCPPAVKKPVVRKDSVIGTAQGMPPSKGSQLEREKVANSAAAEKKYVDDNATATSNKFTTPPPPQQQAVPPHLRGKASKPTEKTDNQEYAATSNDTKISNVAKPSHAEWSSFGDMNEAKRMQSTFTRAGSRRNGDSNFPGGHANNAQQMLDRHNPLNQGWARAGRNPKPVPINSSADVLW